LSDSGIDTVTDAGIRLTSEGRVFAVFDRSGASGNLGNLCSNLLSHQKLTWPDCQRGYDMVEQVLQRTIECSGFSVVIQYNPGRVVSTTAEVGEKDVALRPCFLCEANLPVWQRVISYYERYLLLCNPMPVFREHFTVPSIRHQPQRMIVDLPVFLGLALDCGPEWIVLYNGPRCGASAPDHLHFQITRAGFLPLEKEIREPGRLVPVGRSSGTCIFCVAEWGREAVVFESEIAEELASLLTSFLHALRAELRDSASDEPMVNAVCTHRDGIYRVIVFPRVKHRPDAYFRAGSERLVVSPAVAEMGGVIVTPRRADYDLMSAEVVENLYHEISLDRKTVTSAIGRIV
jgi:hypothetical protein